MKPINILQMRKALPSSFVYLPASLDAFSTAVGANIMFLLDGSITTLEDGTTTPLAGNAWLSSHPDTVNAALYEIKRTQITGTTGVTFTGTMSSGVWYPLSSTRGVSVNPGGSGNSNDSSWQIRLIGGDGTILGSINTTVSADP